MDSSKRSAKRGKSCKLPTKALVPAMPQDRTSCPIVEIQDWNFDHEVSSTQGANEAEELDVCDISYLISKSSVEKYLSQCVHGQTLPPKIEADIGTQGLTFETKKIAGTAFSTIPSYSGEAPAAARECLSRQLGPGLEGNCAVHGDNMHLESVEHLHRSSPCDCVSTSVQKYSVGLDLPIESVLGVDASEPLQQIDVLHLRQYAEIDDQLVECDVFDGQPQVTLSDHLRLLADPIMFTEVHGLHGVPLLYPTAQVGRLRMTKNGAIFTKRRVAKSKKSRKVKQDTLAKPRKTGRKSPAHLVSRVQ